MSSQEVSVGEVSSRGSIRRRNFFREIVNCLGSVHEEVSVGELSGYEIFNF